MPHMVQVRLHIPFWSQKLTLHSGFLFYLREKQKHHLFSALFIPPGLVWYFFWNCKKKLCSLLPNHYNESLKNKRLSWLSLLYTWEDTGRMTHLFCSQGHQVPACWLYNPSFIMLWCCMVVKSIAPQSSSLHLITWVKTANITQKLLFSEAANYNPGFCF